MLSIPTPLRAWSKRRQILDARRRGFAFKMLKPWPRSDKQLGAVSGCQIRSERLSTWASMRRPRGAGTCGTYQNASGYAEDCAWLPGVEFACGRAPELSLQLSPRSHKTPLQRGSSGANTGALALSGRALGAYTRKQIRLATVKSKVDNQDALVCSACLLDAQVPQGITGQQGVKRAAWLPPDSLASPPACLFPPCGWDMSKGANLLLAREQVWHSHTKFTCQIFKPKTGVK